MHFKSPADATDFHSAMLHIYCSAAREFVGVTRKGGRHFLCVNEPGAVLFGYASAAEMILHEQDILSNIKDEELHFDHPATESPGAAFIKEAVFTTKHGIDFFGEIKVNHFLYHGHEYNLIRITDINSYKEKERLVMTEHLRFEALFNHASMGILMADKAGTIITANKLAQVQFGCGKEQLSGKKVEELIPQRFRKNHIHHREQYNKEPKPRVMGTGFDLFALRMDGTEFPVEISLSNFNTPDGDFVIAFIIDITQRKQIEADMRRQQQQIEKLNDELEGRVELRTKQLQEAMDLLEQSKEELSKSLSKERELGDMKSRFVSMASHEFRTPLSTILSSASLLAKYTKSEEQEKRDRHILRIKSSVNNLTDILNDFLSIGKMEDGKIKLSPVMFDLEALLGSIASDMQNQLKQGQEIVYSFSGDKMIWLDPSLLRNAVINLLSNAIKFSAESEAIQLTGVNAGGKVTICVKDNGIGISAEDQKHLFERFFRANNAVNIQGTGLGLHIVAKYVELLGGEIDYKSELEIGTSFTITFAAIDSPPQDVATG